MRILFTGNCECALMPIFPHLDGYEVSIVSKNVNVTENMETRNVWADALCDF